MINIGEVNFKENGENSYISYDYKNFRLEAKKFIPGKEELPFIDKLDVCYFVKYGEENYMITGYDEKRNEYFAPVIGISSK